MAHLHGNCFTVIETVVHSAHVSVNVHKCSISVTVLTCGCSSFLAEKREEKLWLCSRAKLHKHSISRELRDCLWLHPGQGKSEDASLKLTALRSDFLAAGKARQVMVEKFSRKINSFMLRHSFFTVKIPIVTDTCSCSRQCLLIHCGKAALH